ncbi:uncharacterized protein LOC119575520 [Penaeus monodon]|uniref:uncharacterized protein LOC119575520 n=1 Tax=Penaeus monodon TaxID=6687 RepID=UPI0018A777EA|nr:uncharacterized protein LOC119575520 [Penaeus monodon]
MNALTVISVAALVASGSASLLAYNGVYGGHHGLLGAYPYASYSGLHPYSYAGVHPYSFAGVHPYSYAGGLPAVAPLNLKTPVVNTVAPAPVSYNAAPFAPVAPIQSQYHAQDELGQYSFGYSGGPSSRAESRDAFGVVRGSYNYVDSEGKLQTQHYVADALGFRVSGTNLPVAPDAPVTAPLAALPGPLPEPVQDTTEVAAAKAAHQQAYDEAAAAAEAAPDTRKKRSVLAAPGVYSPLRFSYGFSTPFHYAHPPTYASPLHYTAARPALTTYNAAHVPTTYAAAAGPALRDADLLRVVHNPGHATSYHMFPGITSRYMMPANSVFKSSVDTSNVSPHNVKSNHICTHKGIRMWKASPAHPMMTVISVAALVASGSAYLLAYNGVYGGHHGLLGAYPYASYSGLHPYSYAGVHPYSFAGVHPYSYAGGLPAVAPLNLKTPVVNTVAPAPVSYNAAPFAPVAPIQSQYHAQDELGQYSFGYSGGPSSRAESRDAFGVVRGSYNYVDSEGKLQTQHYVADALGFRVSGTNLPVAPDAPVTAPLAALPGPLPEPVQDTTEVAAAKAAHQQAYDEAAAAAEAAPDTRKKRSVLAAPGVYSPLRFSYGFSTPFHYAHPPTYASPLHYTAARPALTTYNAAHVPTTYAAAAGPALRDADLLRVVHNPATPPPTACTTEYHLIHSQSLVWTWCVEHSPDSHL